MEKRQSIHNVLLFQSATILMSYSALNTIKSIKTIWFVRQHSNKYLSLFGLCNCCRKTAVCNGDQLLNFSLPELVRSQSTFSTDTEVLQICAGFTLCSSVGLAVGDCAAVLGFTSCMLCVQIYCVLCALDYYMLNSQL